jgi:hypothetical protein
LDNGSEEPDISFWAEQTQDYGDDMMDYGDDLPTDTFDNADQSKFIFFVTGVDTKVPVSLYSNVNSL